MSATIKTASITDKGLNPRKTVNEDSLLVLEKQRLFAVADGVGGAFAGDVASQSAVKTIQKLVNKLPGEDKLIDFVKSVIKAANTEIYNLASQEHRTMGSTLAMMLVQKDYAILAHIGDSRIYLYRDKQLLQLTRDHSKLQNLIDSLPENSIDEDNYPEKNVITRALGAKATAQPDIQKVNLKNDDIFVICSDGIYNYNTEEELRENVAGNQDDLKKICDVLKENCYQKGAKDHLTAIVSKISLVNSDNLKTMVLKR